MRFPRRFDDVVRWLGLKRMTWEQAVDWLRDRPDLGTTLVANYFDLPVLAAARRFHSSEEFGEVARLLGPAPPGGRALDFGAGNGIASFALASSGWSVVALEPDPSTRVGAGAIRTIAAEAGLPIEICDVATLPLPFPDGTFDVVFGRQVMHHVPDLEATARELARVVRPGGRILITREHVADNWLQRARFLRNHGLNRLYHGENAYPLRRYLTAFTAAGLHVVETWGPMESILNWYPGTEAERLRAVEALVHRTYLGLGRFVADSEELARKALARATKRDRTPGRSFAFLMARA
jgi:SAM-dependent methyltransferase